MKNRKSDSSDEERKLLLSCSKETLEKKRFDTDSLEICADYGASCCVTPDEIDFIPVTYKQLIGLTINGISEGIKVAGCGSVSWIF